MPPTRQQFQTYGDLANVALFLSTALVTYCLLFRYPNEASFDATWLEHGFCVANPHSKIWNSHNLAFYSDCIMSLALAACYYQYEWSSSSKSPTKTPELQRALLYGSITGVFFHGTGHFYVGLMDARGTDFRWDSTNVPLSIVSTSVVMVGLSGIMNGTLAMAPLSRILGTALAGTWGLTKLNVTPNLVFVYIQGLIYLTQSAHLLSLKENHKQTAAYLLTPLLQLPVVAIGVVEAYHCQQSLAPIGGHVVFDTVISVGSLITPILATQMDAAAASFGGASDAKKKAQ